MTTIQSPTPLLRLLEELVNLAHEPLRRPVRGERRQNNLLKQRPFLQPASHGIHPSTVLTILRLVTDAGAERPEQPRAHLPQRRVRVTLPALRREVPRVRPQPRAVLLLRP